jgi:PAS domain S-box-containing protein
MSRAHPAVMDWVFYKAIMMSNGTNDRTNLIRLILIEDNEDDALLISRTLIRNGYSLDVTRVQTDEQLKFALNEMRWDLIICDYQLPDMTGPEALQIARTYAPLTPCIVVTGAMTEDIAVEIMRSGAADFILKQNLSRLAPAVERELRDAVIRRRQLRLERLQIAQRNVMDMLAEGQPLADLLSVVLSMLQHEIPESFCALLLADPSTKTFKIGATRGTPPDYNTLINGSSVHDVSLPHQQVIEERRALYIADINVYTNNISRSSGKINSNDRYCQILTSNNLPCTWIVPVVHADNVVSLPLGVLELQFSRSRYPTLEEEEVIRSIGQFVLIILERKEDEARRAEAEYRLHTVLSHLPAVVWATDRNGVLTFVDGQNAERIGFPEEERVGKSLFEIYQDSPDVTEAFKNALLGTVSHWEQTYGDSIFETHITRLLPEEGGLIIGVTADITERKQLENQLLQSARLAAMGELVAGVVHELNNPLTVISATAQLLAMSPDASIQHDAETIHRMAGRMAQTINSLLNFSRRDSEQFISTDLNQLALSAAEMSKFTLKKSNVKIEIDLDDNLPTVTVVPYQIEQVIINLIRNAEHAVRFLPRARRRITIRTRHIKDDSRSHALLSVADQGVGISQENIARIFEPFFTTKPPGEGTGLGLSISRGIVASHKGSLTVTSDANAGAVFTLQLPLDSAT